MNAPAPLLDISDLTVAFKGGAIPAVDGVDLSIAAGEALAVVGESVISTSWISTSMPTAT